MTDHPPETSMTESLDNPPAFPSEQHETQDSSWNQTYCSGMSLRDWFAGQALANPTICTGTAPEWQLKVWFGDRGGITREEVTARQARNFADAMLALRARGTEQ